MRIFGVARLLCAPAASVALSLSLFGLSASAQYDLRQGSAVLTGEVTSDNPSDLAGGLTVELVDMQSHMVVGQSVAGMDGRFQFANLRPGNYQLRVTNGAGGVIEQQFVTVNGVADFVTVRLPELKRDRPVSGTVSVSRLGHKIPSKARKEFNKALAASEKNDSQRAIEHLKRAIEIDPDFMEAYNNLGARYLHTNQPQEAAQQFEKAIQLDSSSAKAHSNLALAYLMLQRFDEAEREARESVTLDSTSNISRYVLGMALAAQNREPQEAVQNLDLAARELPKARLTAAHVLAREGRSSEAAAELRKYLDSGREEHANEVRAWLAQLEE
jgi:tetratricopeptide (TPR) repeat protein